MKLKHNLSIKRIIENTPENQIIREKISTDCIAFISISFMPISWTTDCTDYVTLLILIVMTVDTITSSIIKNMQQNCLNSVPKKLDARTTLSH